MSKRPFFIWIDDLRPCPNVNYPTITCRDAVSTIDAIAACVYYNTEMYISFDHDLGMGKSGYDVAKYIVEQQIPTNLVHWRIHSANPVGAANIRQLLTHYGYPKFV